MFNKKEFINNLVKELNDVNERQLVYNGKDPLDVPYLVSVVEQNIDQCKEFIEDISKNRYYINGYEEDNSEGYTNGKIRILIEKPDEEKESEYMVDAYHDYCYYIEFLYDERMWGYCQCSPEDEGYNEKHKCCGHGCDWTAPAISITKEINSGYYKWQGDEADYWTYKEEFLTNEQNKNEEVEKYKKEQEKESIRRQIASLQSKLDELNKVS